MASNQRLFGPRTRGSHIIVDDCSPGRTVIAACTSRGSAKAGTTLGATKRLPGSPRVL